MILRLSSLWLRLKIELGLGLGLRFVWSPIVVAWFAALWSVSGTATALTAVVAAVVAAVIALLHGRVVAVVIWLLAGLPPVAAFARISGIAIAGVAIILAWLPLLLRYFFRGISCPVTIVHGRVETHSPSVLVALAGCNTVEKKMLWKREIRRNCIFGFRFMFAFCVCFFRFYGFVTSTSVTDVHTHTQAFQWWYRECSEEDSAVSVYLFFPELAVQTVDVGVSHSLLLCFLLLCTCTRWSWLVANRATANVADQRRSNCRTLSPYRTGTGGTQLQNLLSQAKSEKQPAGGDLMDWLKLCARPCTTKLPNTKRLFNPRRAIRALSCSFESVDIRPYE